MASNMANAMEVGEASRSEGSGRGCRACCERGRYAEVRGQGGAVCVEAFAQPGQRRRVCAEQLLQRRDERGPFTGFRHLRACVRCGSTHSFLFVCSPAHLFGRVVVGGEWWVDERVAPRMAQVLSDRTAEWLRCWLVGGMVAMVVDVMITTVIGGVIVSLVDWLVGWWGSRTAVAGRLCGCSLLAVHTPPCASHARLRHAHTRLCWHRLRVHARGLLRAA